VVHGTVANAHLHGIAHVAATAADAADRHHAGERPHRHSRWWYAGWDSTAWIGLHRGTGVIRGVVRSASGSPVAGASVRLRDRYGHALRTTAAKHVTSTGAGGTFVMTHVRAGSYHVHADGDGGHQGHVALRLHSGEVATVAVKM